MVVFADKERKWWWRTLHRAAPPPPKCLCTKARLIKGDICTKCGNIVIPYQKGSKNVK